MKVVLLYIRVIRKSDPKYVVPKDYDQSSKRFLETYQQFKPAIPHELCVVNCGSETHDGLFDGVASRYETDFSGGFDCGTYQHIGGKQSCDLVVGLNTHTYFWRDGWLEPIVRCAESCGKGVYGVSGSYEQNPHLRTPCIAFSPEVMRQYPHQCLTRLDAGAFEFGPENFSLWAHSNGFPTYLVTEKVTYDIEGWRFPRHGFRDGNQRNCLVWDRHTELYASSDKATKRHLESMANGN